MKRIFPILMLCLMLFVSCAWAEDYTPGETTKALMNSAFEEGNLVGGDLSVHFDIQPEQFASTPEELEKLKAIQEMIHSGHLSIYAGKVKDGLRLEVVGTYSPEGSQESAQITCAATLYKEHVEIESNLLKGKRITAKWETIFALTGASAEDIQMLKTLSETDFDAAVNEMTEDTLAFVEEIPDVLSTFLNPYLETLCAFASTLDFQTKDNVPAQDIFPAADHEASITFTSAQLAELMNTLADQVEKDQNLASVIDNIDDLVSDLRSSAVKLTNENNTYVAVVDYNDNQRLPLSFVISEFKQDGSGAVEMLLLSPNESGLGTDLLLNTYVTNANGELGDSVVLAASVIPGADNKSLDIQVALNASTGSEDFLLLDFASHAAPFTTEDQQPGFKNDLAFSFTLPYKSTSVNYHFTSDSAKTAKNGEKFQMDGSVTVSDTFQTNAMNMQMGLMAEPSENGFEGLLHVLFSCEDFGLDNLGFSWALNNRTYESLDLTEVALETVTENEMNALLQDAQNALMTQLQLFLSLAPQSFVEAISAE